MKVNLILGPNVGISRAGAERLFKKHHIAISKSGYDYTVIIGGDGTFLDNAIACKDKPILFVRKQSDSINGAKIRHGITASISFDELDSVLPEIESGAFKIVGESILELDYGGKRYYSAGDFFVERGQVKQAVRYHAIISYKGGTFETYGISNGFIVTTPIGSTGYYGYPDVLKGARPHRIADGLGFAHILPTKVADTLNGRAERYAVRRAFGPESTIEVILKRGRRQYLYGAGGEKEGIPIGEGTRLRFRISKDKLKVLKPNYT
jgi:hypothetical protein